MEDKEITQKAHALATVVGGLEVFFTGVGENGNIQFSDDVEESMFMPEEEVVRLKGLLEEKTEFIFEIVVINFIK